MPYNRKYIGARYIPKFASPIDWSDSLTYEPLMIVMHNGDTYTSAQFVPAGISITNGNYWVKTADYNAQIAQFAEDLTTLENAVDSIDDDVTALENRFPVSVADGGTGLTEFQPDKILKSNAAGNAVDFAEANDIAAYIGDNPVARAIADENGNDIIDTYATKQDVLGLEIITQYSEIFDTAGFEVCNVSDISKFKFVRFGKVCLVSAWYTLKENVVNNDVIQRFGVFKKYAPIATLPNIAVWEYMHCTYDYSDGRKYSVISDSNPAKWLGFVCMGYDVSGQTNLLPKANEENYIELMYICE